MYRLMCQSVLVLGCLTLVGHVNTLAASLETGAISPCGSCICNTRQASADCSGKRLSIIPTDLPTDVTNLNLARNQITMSSDHQATLCQRYPYLRKVSLAWNGLTSLSRLFAGCQYLQQLDLTGNLLETIHPRVFQDLHQLQVLDSLEVQELHENIFYKLTQLETLNLTYSGLTIKPGMFRELSVLTSLTLTLEKVLRIPKQLLALSPGSVLKHLTFRGLKVKDIPDSLFSEMVNLKELHLDLPHLLKLKIATKNKPVLLQVLEMSNMRSVAEDVLSGLPNLQVVMLHGIHHLAGEQLFQTATSVQELEIVQCSMTQMPPGWLDNMIALEILNLSENRLMKLSQSDLVQLTSLKHLILSNNKLEDVATGVLTPVKSTLRQLLLNDNQITELSPEMFTDMQMLEVLDLRRNMINNIDANSLRNLPRLQILQLSGNYISFVDHVMFHSFPMLEELNLSENMISHFPENLLASNISHLILSFNSLHQLPAEKMCHMTHLQSFNVDDNPLLCDCSLRFLHKCLPHLLLSGTCSSPDSVAGQNIDEITPCAPSSSLSAMAETSHPTPLDSVLSGVLTATPTGLTYSDLTSRPTSDFSLGDALLMFTSDLQSVTTSTSASMVPLSSTVTSYLTLSSTTAKLEEPTQLFATSRASPLTLLAISPSSVELVISPNSVTDTLRHLPTPKLVEPASEPTAPVSLSSHINIMLETSLDLAISRSWMEVIALPVTLATRNLMTATHISPAPVSGLSHSHELPEEIDPNYDVYTGPEIVRPLVAFGIPDTHDKFSGISGVDQGLATELAIATAVLDSFNISALDTQFDSMNISAVNALFDSFSTSAVDAQFDSFNISELDRQINSFNTSEVNLAAISERPHQDINDTESLLPKIAQVKANPDTQETSGFLSVAGEITVAMFFSLIIVLSVLSGVLLYRKYFHVGSYNAASSFRDIHPHQHFIQIQPVDADLAASKHSTVTMVGAQPEPAVTE